jgi:hypothetical protein
LRLREDNIFLNEYYSAHGVIAPPQLDFIIYNILKALFSQYDILNEMKDRQEHHVRYALHNNTYESFDLERVDEDLNSHVNIFNRYSRLSS